MSNYSYIVSRSNVSILLTTLSNRTNPPFVANIKDENSTRRTSAITIVNNWHTSIARTFGSGSSQRGSRRVVPQTTLPRREEDCIVRSMTYEWLLICLCRIMQLVKLSKSATRSKHTRLQLAHIPQNAPTCSLLRAFSDCNLWPSRTDALSRTEQLAASTQPTLKNFQKIRTRRPQAIS